MVIHIVWIKYIPFIIIGLTFLYMIYKIVTTEHLLRWVIRSMEEENGKPSGKSLAGFACINSLLIGFFVNIYYADKHTPEEWYVITLATLVASFYGLREFGKFTASKFGGAEATTLAPPPTSVPVLGKAEPNKPEQSDEIG